MAHGLSLTLAFAIVFAASSTTVIGNHPAAVNESINRAEMQAAGLSNKDIVNLVTAGLSDAIIIAAIRDAKERNFDVSANGLINLKKAKVPDAVIAAMLNPSALGASVALASATPATSAAGTVELKVPDGTEVRLRLLQSLTSATARVNDTVRFEAVDDVSVGGVIVIAKGAVALGSVTQATSKKSFGRSGKLNFTIDAVKAVDGSNVRLRSTKENKGSESYGKAGVVTILAGPFGALVKGKDVEISAGTEYSIFIDGDRTMSIRPGK